VVENWRHGSRRRTLEAEGAMSPKQTHKSDREMFADALRLFDRPEDELHQQPLPADADVDAFVEKAFGYVTVPPC
jgi:hypothetical protein